jgi:hypothetical protein
MIFGEINVMNDSRIRTAIFVVAALLLQGVANTALADAVAAREWNFRVYLDDAEIGYHNFRLENQEGRQRLITEADFKVKFLFVTAYRYRHENTEVWQGDCLVDIEARTNANGKKLQVRGTRQEDIFRVEAAGMRNEIPECVKTFAYWNADVLEESSLLNAQTGELLDIDVESVASEAVTVQGEEVEALRYRLRAKGVDLDLWYSKDSRWLGLESTTKGGRKLRYELI